MLVLPLLRNRHIRGMQRHRLPDPAPRARAQYLQPRYHQQHLPANATATAAAGAAAPLVPRCTVRGKAHDAQRSQLAARHSCAELCREGRRQVVTAIGYPNAAVAGCSIGVGVAGLDVQDLYHERT